MRCLLAGLLVACSGAPAPQEPTTQFSGGRPVLRAGERLVLDVATHQGRIDWQQVAGDGIAGAYVKANEGGDFRDKRFATNWRGLEAAGLERGAYHYFTFCRHGEEQAANFLAAAPPTKGSLPPAVDLETAGNCALRPSRADLLAELRAFLAPVEAAWGKRAVLYVSHDVQDRYGIDEALGRPAWTRSLGRRPVGDWLLWQVSDRASVVGVEGGVDLDVLGDD